MRGRFGAEGQLAPARSCRGVSCRPFVSRGSVRDKDLRTPSGTQLATARDRTAAAGAEMSVGSHGSGCFLGLGGKQTTGGCVAASRLSGGSGCRLPICQGRCREIPCTPIRMFPPHGRATQQATTSAPNSGSRRTPACSGFGEGGRGETPSRPAEPLRRHHRDHHRQRRRPLASRNGVSAVARVVRRITCAETIEETGPASFECPPMRGNAALAGAARGHRRQRELSSSCGRDTCKQKTHLSSHRSHLCSGRGSTGPSAHTRSGPSGYLLALEPLRLRLLLENRQAVA